MATANTTNKADMFITVDDGLRRVPIRNTYGDEIGVFFFHPTDMGIIERYNAMINDYPSIVEPLEGISINAEGEVDGGDEKQIAALTEAENRMKDAVNKLFKSDSAGELFFGSMHPFSPVNGTFYCEGVLEAVGKYITAQFETETAKFSERVAKYTKRAKK